MRDADIDALQASLLRNGIQPRYACRVAEELRAHVEELRDAYLAEGFDAEQADRRASRSIGRPEDLIAEMTARRELKTWAFRFPFLAVMFYPLACLVALPAVPVIAGVAHAPAVARWGASLLAAGAMTSVLLLLLQLSILFG